MLLVLAALAASLPFAAAGVAGSATCSVTSTGGALPRITMADGRSYLLYVPAGLVSGTSGVPLLVSLHGLNSNATQMAGYTGWQADADAKKYVVAYPEGVGETWQIGDDSPDVAFVRRVITDISGRYCVNRVRVHVVGHSMGAYLAQRLACDANDVVASVAAYAGGPTTLGGFGCTLERPVAVGLWHGADDRLVATSLGRTSRDQWVGRDGCAATPQTVPSTDGTRLRYTPCAAGVTVWWHEYPGQRHGWPTGTRASSMRSEMWSLFDGNRLPV